MDKASRDDPAAADDRVRLSAHRARRHRIRRAFDQAADGYDAAAEIQRAICQALQVFGRETATATTPRPNARVLDAGCGTGFGQAAIELLCPGASLLALDLAPAMLERARSRHGAQAASRTPTLMPVCADLEHLPLADACLAMVWSSLAMQWCDPARALAECARVLAPGGVALIATLGPATLHELRDAFASIDDARHTIEFHPASRWVQDVTTAGLAVEALDTRPMYACAEDLRSLLRDIKAIGAATVDHGRRREALGRAAWMQLQAQYERHRRSDGLLPATYDVILLALRKPLIANPPIGDGA